MACLCRSLPLPHRCVRCCQGNLIDGVLIQLVPDRTLDICKPASYIHWIIHWTVFITHSFMSAHAGDVISVTAWQMQVQEALDEATSVALQSLATQGIQAKCVGVGLEALHLAGIDLHALHSDIAKFITHPYNLVLPGLFKARMLEVRVDVRTQAMTLNMITDWTTALRALDIDGNAGMQAAYCRLGVLILCQSHQDLQVCESLQSDPQAIWPYSLLRLLCQMIACCPAEDFVPRLLDFLCVVFEDGSMAHGVSTRAQDLYSFLTFASDEHGSDDALFAPEGMAQSAAEEMLQVQGVASGLLPGTVFVDVDPHTGFVTEVCRALTPACNMTAL